MITDSPQHHFPRNRVHVGADFRGSPAGDDGFPPCQQHLSDFQPDHSGTQNQDPISAEFSTPLEEVERRDDVLRGQPLDLRPALPGSGRQDDDVRSGPVDQLGRNRRSRVDDGPGAFQTPDHAIEHSRHRRLALRLNGERELPSQGLPAFVERDRMTSPCGGDGGAETRRAAADDHHRFRRCGRLTDRFSDPRVGHAGDGLSTLDLAETGLETCSAEKDRILISPEHLVGEIRIGDQGPGEADQIRRTMIEDLPDPVGESHPSRGDYRQRSSRSNGIQDVDLGPFGGATVFFGEIGEPGDVDLFPIEVTDDYLDGGGAHHCWSFWPTNLQNLTPLMTLYDEEGNVLAQTLEPDFTTDWYGIYDSGICRYIDQAGYYFLEVTDADGSGATSDGYFYPGLKVAYIEEVAPPEEEQNDDKDGANLLEMTNSSSSPDYWYGGFWGTLETPTDELDMFGIVSTDVGGLDGKYLNVYLSTARYGSLLDAQLTVYQDDGSGNLVELGSASADPEGSRDDDPAVWDLKLDAEGTLYFAVSREDDAEPAMSHFYMGYVNLDSEAHH